MKADNKIEIRSICWGENHPNTLNDHKFFLICFRKQLCIRTGFPINGIILALTKGFHFYYRLLIINSNFALE